MKRPGKPISRKNSIVLDTNVIIRFLVGDEETLYQKAAGIFSDIENDLVKAVILESVLAETVFVLEKVYRVERALVADVLLRILDLKGMRNTNKQILRTAVEYYKRSKIDIVDCLVCAFGVLNEMEIVSFDKDLKSCKKFMGQQKNT
ncbi:MAG: PIN domain-containing protein [bacterium]